MATNDENISILKDACQNRDGQVADQTRQAIVVEPGHVVNSAAAPNSAAVIERP